MHPPLSERHIADESMTALRKHFSPLVLKVGGLPHRCHLHESPSAGHTVELSVRSAQGSEIARYELSVTAHRVAAVKEPKTQKKPEFITGSWADVKAGYCVYDPDGGEWKVEKVSGHNVTISKGEQTHCFVPDLGQSISYRRECLWPF